MLNVLQQAPSGVVGGERIHTARRCQLRLVATHTAWLLNAGHELRCRLPPVESCTLSMPCGAHAARGKGEWGFTQLPLMLQVKEIEAAALRAAHDGAMQIENALAAAADKVWHSSRPAVCSGVSRMMPDDAKTRCRMVWSTRRKQSPSFWHLCAQRIDASEVAALRTRLWEEETATKEAQVQRSVWSNLRAHPAVHPALI